MTQGFQNDPGTLQQEAGFGFDGPFWKESDLPNLTAFAGGGQANATLLNAMFNRIGVVANLNDSVKLPPSRASLIGVTIGVCNDAVNNAALFASGNDTINGTTAGGSVPLMGKSLAYFACTGIGTWVATGLGFGYATGPGLSAGFTTYSTQTGITASATQTAAGGTQINASQAQISVCAVAGNAVTLPPAKPGMEITIVNNGAQNAGVFGATQAQGGQGGGDTIAGVGTAFVLVPTTPTIFYCFVVGNWVTK
jgi:hypothetical protein